MTQFFAISPPIVWLVLMILFAVAEGVSVGLTSIWFALGALVALLVSLICPNLWVQSFVFVGVSLLTLCLIRPLARRYFQPKGHTPTNADRILGKVGIVTEPIDNLAASGQIKVAGQIWTARSATDEPISAGVHVTVLRIEGVRVFVQPVTDAVPTHTS